jgi:putative hydrolase of the HAD superfamily
MRDGLPAVAPEVLKALGQLRAAGWMIAIVTNGEAEVQSETIERVGLLGAFDACCISGELGIRKPDRHIFEIAVSRCGGRLGDAGDAWMIRDGEPDVEGAWNAGIPSIWLHRGRKWTRTDVLPTLVAGSLPEALGLLPDRTETSRSGEGPALLSADERGRIRKKVRTD